MKNFWNTTEGKIFGIDRGPIDDSWEGDPMVS